ncbi:MAG TPA: hypothetical protein VIF15_19610 [Polyangiaceae bacterium]|jgi:hypothetical protein
MSAHVKWAKGGHARVVAIEANAIVLRSSVPSPPGSRIEGTLEGSPAAALRVKVHTARKQPEGDFVLEGRPLDMTSETRARLEELLRPVDPS